MKITISLVRSLIGNPPIILAIPGDKAKSIKVISKKFKRVSKKDIFQATGILNFTSCKGIVSSGKIPYLPSLLKFDTKNLKRMDEIEAILQDHHVKAPAKVQELVTTSN